MPKLRKTLPKFYEEIQILLIQANRNDLADSFEIAGAKQSTFTSTLALKPQTGKISVGLDQLGRITFFEVRNRPDLRRKLFRTR